MTEESSTSQEAVSAAVRAELARLVPQLAVIPQPPAPAPVAPQIDWGAKFDALSSQIANMPRPRSMSAEEIVEKTLASASKEQKEVLARTIEGSGVHGALEFARELRGEKTEASWLDPARRVAKRNMTYGGFAMVLGGVVLAGFLYNVIANYFDLPDLKKLIGLK